ncbi:MAG: FkbM family methyltransferase [Patescibacteria group bacterium]
MINPNFFLKRVFFEIAAAISPFPEQPVFKNINGVMINFDFKDEDKARKMYFGTFQPAIADILKKYLKKGDTFIDAGANVGYFTAVAAGLVGQSGQVHSFEPVQEYFQKLKNLKDKNSRYKITTNQLALGDKEKTEKIYIGGPSHIGDNTFFLDFLEGISEVKSAEVKVVRLDKYIKDNDLCNIKLIKIDVEGFEFPLLLGMEEYFLECSKTGNYPKIICEICPKAYSYLGKKLEDLFDYMKNFSYEPFETINENIGVNINKLKERDVADVLFKPAGN